ncbi:hypothetical protein F5B22DRAFT_146038 [Xylaria bambusicola]|uniref:uncharacterized protein n=1 Tax=Xylaria bambusicola TaxID=326684 RepID=UPI0020078C96|nr:uncharacterized protein F5B22DRAFT_146038 [Xylaria bambusicola]KAI0526164.1 hypothetical protein F5B22DRAFT_146038 [Xylaria bambusicola]
MGAQVSAYVRLQLNSSTLEDLLSDDKFVGDLEQELVGLESKSQKNLEKLLKCCRSPNSSAKKDPNDMSTKLRPLWEIRPEDVAIPSEIANAFKEWKLDHLAFLRRKFSLGLQVPSSPDEHYCYTLNVQASLASDRILRRFLTTVYYDLISKHSQSDRNSITKVGVEFVAAVICRAGSYNNETVQKYVSSWAKEGGKFHGLADAMDGLGCYFFLPVKVSDWIWLKYLTQEHHESAITLLRKHGIIEKAREQGAQSLATKIERSLRAPFEEAISLTLQVRQQIVPVTAMALAQGVDTLPGRSQISTNHSQPPADPLQPLTSSPSPGGHLQTPGTCPPASPLYSSAVHASPSLEISPRPSEVGHWSGNTNMHRPKQLMLGYNQAKPNNLRNNAEEIKVMDINNTPLSRALNSFSGSNSNAIPRLAANSLIKMQ